MVSEIYEHITSSREIIKVLSCLLESTFDVSKQVVTNVIKTRTLNGKIMKGVWYSLTYDLN